MVLRASRAGQIALPVAVAAGIGLAVARALGLPIPAWALFSALGALFATIGWGVFSLRSGVFARPILAGTSSNKVVAITFDDGPHPVHTRALLDLLESRGHRGTFFVIGKRAEANADVIAEIARRGHGLGNHSFEHSHLTPMRSRSRLTDELVHAGDVIERAAGKRTKWFRPPVGLLSPPVVAAARAAKLELVGWSATARDGVARATVEDSAARLILALQPGAILVLHDAAERGERAPIAKEVLERLLPELEARGLRSVSLDELLA
jgi:peptidoglycan/xylan/chitin deacetylase (PgdA/CDA1 family)